jgi:hypothetical protein
MEDNVKAMSLELHTFLHSLLTTVFSNFKLIAGHQSTAMEEGQRTVT